MFRIEYIYKNKGRPNRWSSQVCIYNTISHPSLNVYCLDSLSMKTILFDCMSAFQCVYISRRNLSARIIDGLIETFFKILKLIAWLPHHIAFPSSIRHTGQTSNKRESPFCKKILTIYTVVLCTYYRLFEDNFKRIGKLYTVSLFIENESKRITVGILNKDVPIILVPAIHWPLVYKWPFFC